MKPLDIKSVKEFVNENIVAFHQSRLKCLEELKLKKILKNKNPYLFRAKNIGRASDLVEQFLAALLSSSEEKLFGNFLEDLAIFVAEQTCDGRKSAATGVDFEFVDDGVHYLVSVKSGPNWGNSGQQSKQEADFKTAVKVLKQSKRARIVEPVLGICYGKTRSGYVRGYHKVVGQNFWYLISKNEELYADIIEPLGYRARQHNDRFIKMRDRIINLFTEEFVQDFCTDGGIDWRKLVEFNSGNLDLK